MQSLGQMRANEFARLGSEVYVDHAGATLPSERQLRDVFQDLAGSVYGNPHTEAGGGGDGTSAAAIEDARAATLAMCRASPADYECVFTSGATGALKLVAEAFPWSAGSVFAYTVDNHNSVVGMREEALAAGATAQAVLPTRSQGGWRLHPTGERMQRSAAGNSVSGTHAAAAAPPIVSNPADSSAPGGDGGSGGSGSGGGEAGGNPEEPAPPPLLHLFAHPAESNFSGVRYNPSLAAAVRRPGDSAAALAVNPAGAAVGAAAATDGTTAGRSAVAPAVRRPAREDAAGPAAEESSAEAVVHRRAEAAGGGPEGRWLVALDAAKACGTSPPDLSGGNVDFLALSYYKIFGYPTGLGALLVRRDALPLLRKRFFGGGTVAVSVADADYHRKREGAAGLEDGTASFLGIAALRHGFAAIERAGGFPAIDAHTSALTRHTVQQLVSLRHFNGRLVAKVYGSHVAAAAAAAAAAEPFTSTAAGAPAEERCPRHASAGSEDGATLEVGSSDGGGGGGGGGSRSSGGGGRERDSASAVVGQGPIVAFNLRRADGSWVGYREVEKLAGLWRIRLRTGAFCNPGAAAAALRLSADDVRAHFETGGHTCWDDHDIIDGRPTGAVRASFGYMSSLADAEAVVALVRDFFVEAAPGTAALQAEAAAAAAEPVSAQSGAAAAAASEPVSAQSGVAAAAAGGATAAAGAPLAGTPQARADVAAASSSAACPPAEPLLAATRQWQAAPAHPAGHGTAGCSAGSASTDRAADGLQHSAAASVACSGSSSSTAGGCRLAGLWVYPIKSAAAVAAASWPLGPNGLAFDREWAVVGPTGGVLRRGRHQRLAAIQPHLDLEAGIMHVHSPHADGPLRISLALQGGEQKWQPGVSVRVCGDLVSGCAAVSAAQAAQPPGGGGGGKDDPAGADAAAAWFTAAVGTPCTLVRQQAGARTAMHVRQRHSQEAVQSSSDGAGRSETIGFANEGQLLLLSAASLAELRRRIPLDDVSLNALRPSDSVGGVRDANGSDSSALAAQQKPAAGGGGVPGLKGTGASPAGDCGIGGGGATAGGRAADLADVARFRPNLLVEGSPAFAEDAWRRLRIGPATFSIAGPCARCEMVCGDPATGQRSGPEPLLTLASFRRHRAAINFGVLLGGGGGGGNDAGSAALTLSVGMAVDTELEGD